jgi:DNA-directed RNA polymerase subunit L
MNPSIDNIFLDDDVLEFTLKNIDMTIANTLRRTILSDIETCVFKTAPHSECNATIELNTTSLNNEILKQRLSCIPIHITDPEFPIDNIIMVLDEENTTNLTRHITTEHFKLFDRVTNDFISQKEVSKIFPENKLTKQHIDFVRLRPQISSEIPGEKIKLNCKITKSSAKEDYMFNVACNSTYGYTPDKDKIDDEWNKKEKELKKDDTITVDDLEYIKKDWYNLDAKRIFVENSFDFTIHTIGVYTPYQLVTKACKVLYDDFEKFKNSEMYINNSDSTINNSFDIYLYEKDHTFGKCLEYLLHTLYFKGDNKINYCGFQMKHPHDNYSIIRLAYINDIDKDVIIKDIQQACDVGIQLFTNMENLFID